MNSLKLYAVISRLGRLNYRAKIMVMAFLGTHIPLLAIIGWSAFNLSGDAGMLWGTLAVALVATLGGTGVTLFVLNQLLQPVLLTSRALRTYRQTRQLSPLPTNFTDEAGTLMADAALTLARLDASLVELETTDKATGLANRDKFVAALGRTLAAQTPAAVCVVRIANYLRLVTSYDQEHADRLASQLAMRLVALLPADTLAARVEGASFAFIRMGEEAENAGPALAAMLDELSKVIVVEGVEAMPALTGGVARSGVDGDAAAALLDGAIAAAVVTTAIKSVSVHSPAARQAVRERFELEQELRKGIENNQFVLHYQPVVDMLEGRSVGAEALIRWQHPERGMIPPAQFIPAAERSGMIDQIGLWVMQAACEQLGRWNAEGLEPLKLAINLSAGQFLDPRLRDIVSDVLNNSAVSPGQLEIELTESAAMVDHDYTRRTFGKLKDLGVSIAIDDFGTGYASMSQLRKLPFDKLKIDREFVANVDTTSESQAICNAMITLANGLGLKVLAEGTERPEEVRYLSERGCNLFQGYYFARPVSAAQFAETLHDVKLMAAAAMAPSPASLASSAMRDAG